MNIGKAPWWFHIAHPCWTSTNYVGIYNVLVTKYEYEDSFLNEGDDNNVNVWQKTKAHDN
jgi:hypothetical protein